MRIFRSVRFNIILFGLIGAACALGTVLPQAGESPEKAAAFLRAHAFWGPILGRLGLFGVFTSGWFRGLLALMAFDIVACKLASRPPDPGFIRLAGEESAAPSPGAERVLAAKPYYASFSSGLTGPSAARAAGAALARRGYALRASEAGDRRLVVGTRHRAQRWGSYLAHVSLVVLLAGALIKSVFGFEELVPMLEGQTRALRRLSVEVRLDKFEADAYPGTREPRSFASDLRVWRVVKHPGIGPEPFETEAWLGAKRVRVNDPFDIPMDRWGLTKARIYQASWGAGGMFRSVTLGLGRLSVRLPQRTWVPVAGTGIDVMADMMLPDFTMGKDGRPTSASLEPLRPAVRFLFRQAGRRTAPLWLIEGEPRACYAEGPDGSASAAPEPPFRITGLEPVLFSGLQAAYDPGYPAVLLGAAGLLAGLCLLFYLHRRRVWVLIAPCGDGCRVHVAGFSSRGARDFRAGFDRLVEELHETLAEGGSRPAELLAPSAAGTGG